MRRSVLPLALGIVLVASNAAAQGAHPQTSDKGDKMRWNVVSSEPVAPSQAPAKTEAEAPPTKAAEPTAAAAAAPTTETPAAADPAPEEEEGTLTIKASRPVDMDSFAKDSLQELKVGGVRSRYALNLFGDVSVGALSRSEGTLRRPDPAFAAGVFDMLFTGELESNFKATAEVIFRYAPNAPLTDMTRLHLRWQPSKHFFIEAGRFHTDLGYWNNAYHHGRWLQLSIERPRTILLHGGGLLPTHWLGAQAGVSVDVGKGQINLVGSIGSARDPLFSSASAHAHGGAETPLNGGHAKLEFQGFGLRDLRFGVAGVIDRIRGEGAFTRPSLPDQSIDELVGNAFIAYPGSPVLFISEAYVIQHSLNGSARPENAGSKWRTLGAFAMLGYQIGKVTPYVRAEYIGSEVGAYIFDPFYVPETKSIEGFQVSLDVKEAIVGARIDFTTWCALKAEYQVMGGIGTRRWDLPTPLIHSGYLNWSFGI